MTTERKEVRKINNHRVACFTRLWRATSNPFYSGAGRETRTPKGLPPIDFESIAVTNFATPAIIFILLYFVIKYNDV